jgi:DNA-binding transcriptional LysR family regulator
MFDWDDLRIFLAAARAGSLAAAGQRLGLDTATVGRRIARLETSLKSTLLVRSRSGVQLTAAGAQLLETGIEAENAIERAAHGAHPDVVAGTVRISAAEGFGTAVIAPALPALAELRPGLRIELAAAPGILSASRREVDIAISLGPPDAHRLVVEPLTDYQLALYAAPEYLERHGVPQHPADLSKHQIVGYVADLIYAAELRYLDEVRPGLTPALASSSIRGQREIIVAGGGLGVLPCFLAQGLVRVLPGEILLQRRFWLSTHAEVHETTRIRIVRSWLKALVQDRRDLLSPYPA